MKRILYALALKKLLVLFLIGCVLAQSVERAQAQALPVQPVANYVVNRAVAGVITRYAITRGFAANDPRIAATLLGMQKAASSVNVASTAVGVAFAIAGAPVWVTVAASLGVLVVGASVVTGQASVLFNTGDNSQTVKVIRPDPPVPSDYVPAPVPPANVYTPYDSYIRAGVKVYRTDSCFSGDACFKFPLPPVIFNPPITVKIDDGTRAALTLAAVATYWGIDDFKARFVFRPSTYYDNCYFVTESDNSSHPCFATAPGEKQAYSGTYMSVKLEQWWEWVSDPQIVVNSKGDRSIRGKIRIHRTCTEYYPDYCYGYGFDSYNDVDYSSGAELTMADTGGTFQYRTLDQAYTHIPDVKAQPLTRPLVGRITNKLFQMAASQPDYQGLPYDPMLPLDDGDVLAWQNENPNAWPKLDDFLRPASQPVSDPATGTTSNPEPVLSTDPHAYPAVQPTNDPAASNNVNVVNTPNVNVVNTPNVNVINDLHVDLGPNPGISQTSLEDTPSALQILKPLTDWLNQKRSVVWSAHVGVCPRPTVDLWGKTYTLESHCTLMGDYGATLRGVMLAGWTAVAFFVVFSA